MAVFVLVNFHRYFFQGGDFSPLSMKAMQVKNEILKTSDFERISDLDLVVVASLSFSIEAIDRDPKEYPRVVFLFKKTPELEVLIQAYWNGQLSCEPQALFGQLRRIKSRIYNNQ